MQVSVSKPNLGMSLKRFDDVKRLKLDQPSSFETVEAAHLTEGTMAGEGDYPTTAFNINPTTEYSFKNVPNQINDMIEELLEQSIVMVDRRTAQSTVEIRNKIEGYSLPMVHLKIHENMLKGIPQEPYDVLRDWMMAGIMTGHPGPMGSKGYAREIIVVGHGDIKVINHWGPGVHAGHHLFFVIKQVPVEPDAGYVLDRAGMTMKKPGTVARYFKNGKEVVKDLDLVTRFVPVYSEMRYVSAKDLMYKTDYGTWRMGIPVYVGRCIKNMHKRTGISETEQKLTNIKSTINVAVQQLSNTLDVYVGFRN